MMVSPTLSTTLMLVMSGQLTPSWAAQPMTTAFFQLVWTPTATAAAATEWSHQWPSGLVNASLR